MYNNFVRAFARNTNNLRTAATTTKSYSRKAGGSAGKQYNNNNNNNNSSKIFCLHNIGKVFKRTMSSDTEVPTTSAAAAAAATKQPKHTNRLINEKSPYLLQHAHNPVDWYPWGDEALERARKENKMIFLSVGYSTCHWCHVMEHESFEDEEVAALMNEHFINIKVDREERPDIDKIYMQFTVMLNGHGGWPMSVWLTPDLAPITAGTYFPPTNRYGVPAFRTALTAIAKQWSENEEKLKITGLKVISAIQSAVSMRSESTNTSEAEDTSSADAKLEEAVVLYKRRYDSLYGGFGSHPKFPEVPRLSLLFHAYLVNNDIDVLDMALTTLEKIAQGGIHDHIGGGFSRYAVDCVWHVPHFEKMLYDQGQLMSAYAAAFKLTGDKQFLNAAEGIYEYLMRDLSHDLGAFYAGEDADSLPSWESPQKVEGAFYAWHWTEIEAALQKHTEAFDHLKLTHLTILNAYAAYYDLSTEGNVNASSDPHEHFNEKNILIMRGNADEICLKFGLSQEQLQEIVQIMNKILLKKRAQKPRPHLDTKIICSWNALALSGLCELAGCETQKRAEYLQTAQQLYEFMHEHFYVAETQTLLHAVYGEIDKKHGLSKGQHIKGFLDDYAFLINALLSYYKLTLDAKVLEWAWQLQEKQQALFWDVAHSGYFYTQADAKDLVARLKDDHDGAEPSGNSIAAKNLVLLSHYFDAPELAKNAEHLLQTFTEATPFGYTLPQMLSAQLLLEHGIDIVAVVGTEAESKEFLNLLRQYYIPGLVIFQLDPSCKQAQSTERIARLEQKYKMINNKTTVYICHNRVCRLPLTDVNELEKTLKENYYSPRP